MDGRLQHTGSAGLAPSGSNLPKRTTQQPLSCAHCRQRKIKCDKTHPCANCKRSGLDCVFPERVRHPKKRRENSKANNEELMRRLARMEELIEKITVEEKDEVENKLRSYSLSSPAFSQGKEGSSGEGRLQQESGADVNRFIGSAYWRSLTNEVEGLRQTMADVSDGEEQSPPALSETNTSHSSVVFGGSWLLPTDLSSIHPSSAHMKLLCDFYVRNVEPMFKLLHTPTLWKLMLKASANRQTIPSANYVEALLFAVYYAAITSLTEEQCQQYFQDSRDVLLAKYRSATETALVHADLMNTTELGTVQALAIFIISVRANDDSQFSWTLTSVALRLATALGLHREDSRSGLSPFTIEIRRRLWWQMTVLDIRAVEDRGSDPMILPGTFNTKRPLNINDSDMDPEDMLPIPERHGFTEMTKSAVSHIVWETAVAAVYVPPVKDGEGGAAPKVSFEQREILINQLEKRIQSEILIHCDPSSPIAWTTAVIIRLIMARLRLVLYHPPLHDNRSPSHENVARDVVLLVAIENMEYSHLLDTDPAAEPWRWFFKTYVQWHALAAALAELCVQDKGPLVERAWRIIDVVFDDWAARIADSRNGMLWRPIKKLKNKAQARRNESRSESVSSAPQQQQALPLFGTPNFNQFQNKEPIVNWTSQASPSNINRPSVANQSFDPDQALTPDAFASLNGNETLDTINWTQWDEFMQDFQMSELPTDANFMQQDMGHQGVWW